MVERKTVSNAEPPNLSEPLPVSETLIHGAAIQCDDASGVCRIVGWTEVSQTFPPDPAEPRERVVVLRAVMPLDRAREFIRAAARVVGLVE